MTPAIMTGITMPSKTKNGKATNGTPAAPPPGMAQFDDLIKKLARVPKEELDAEVKKYEQKKKVRRRAKSKRR